MIAGDTSKFVLTEILHKVMQEKLTPDEYDEIIAEANRRSLKKMNPGGTTVYSLSCERSAE